MISIIIPCYNSEKYILKNLKSLLNQSCKDFEAIFIDDGSSDRTIEYINEYLNDNIIRYKVYSTSHKGVGAARNFGIKMSSAPYIMFLDSDDYLKDYAVEICIKEIKDKNPDIIIGEYIHENNNKVVWEYRDTYEKFNLGLNKYDILNLIFDNRIHIVTSNAIYNSKLFKNIKFSEKCEYHEDLNVWYKLINNAETFTYIPEILFGYVIRNDSISHNFDINKLQQGIYMLKELINTFENDRIPDEIINKIIRKTIPNICYLFFNNLCLNYDNIIEIYKKNKYFEFMKNANIENKNIRSIIKYLRIKLIAYLPGLYILVWKIYREKMKPLIGR